MIMTQVVTVSEVYRLELLLAIALNYEAVSQPVISAAKRTQAISRHSLQ
jgi:hypothetical protein